MTSAAQMNVVFPDWFDDYEWETIAKGYFVGVILQVGEDRYRPVFYDPSRLAQEISDALRGSNGYFADRNLVVVQAVDRLHIVAAAERLAAQRFEGLTPSRE
jgi:hypothetical protein